ncbi:hypothetical protein HOF56_02680 [Candidatus Peribacteria bacterium]|jgi:hypothetical protein|nr:hypothetical protein [Candidatus Peribacteria bacterium]MBT4020944.1 hypothetical protein [Candidatus Peribacteria bacterium]MBT4240294.1 hypothetical protein [Candidatus Peribacteria bacterium]MBT4473909.1 hypothetical protein [Candidatus Peribacteria bacterium]
MIHPKRDNHSWFAFALTFCGVALFLVGIIIGQPEVVQTLNEYGLHGVAPEVPRHVPQWMFIIACAFVSSAAFLDVKRRLEVLAD